MKIVPHQASFDQIKKWRTFNDYVLLSSTLIVIATTVFEKTPILGLNINDGLNAINSMLIGFYIACETASGYLLFKIESKRRLDFIDNSFETNLSGKRSEEYFTNSNLEPGLYKMAVNCFENVFFSYNISKRMLPIMLFKNLAIIIVFILAASLGEKQIVILIFQLSLPVILFQQLIKLWVYNLNTEIVLGEFQSLFDDLKSTDHEKKSAKILRNIIHYESNISWASLLLSSRIFNKLNMQLSQDWIAMKTDYKISSK